MMVLVLVTLAPSHYNKCAHPQVYQLLEEMVDYGFPLTTEPNALKAMIRPPTIMGELLLLFLTKPNNCDQFALQGHMLLCCVPPMQF